MKFVTIKTVCVPGAAPQDTLFNVESIVQIYEHNDGYWVIAANGGFHVDKRDAEIIFKAIGARLK